MSAHPNPDKGLVDLAIAYLEAARRTSGCEIEALSKATRVFRHALGEPARVKAAIAPPRRKPPAPSARARFGGGAARAKPAAPKSASALTPSIPQPAVIRNGITIRFDHDAESIAFNGAAADLTARHASFLEILLGASPNPVTRELIAANLWASPPATVDTAISKLSIETRALVEPIGLVVKTMRGAGVALQVADSGQEV